MADCLVCNYAIFEKTKNLVFTKKKLRVW